MSEKVIVYNLTNPYEALEKSRKDFYDEQFQISKQTWTPTQAVEIVNVFLFTESWELILQKRSWSKNHNPNLIDKAVGWHIVYGDTPDYTVMVETIQELQVPSIVLKNHLDFQKTFHILQNYLSSIAVIEKVTTSLVQIEKLIHGEKLKFGNKTHLYFGIYGWSLKNVDAEAKGILFYTLEDLEVEMQQYPDLFTQDLHYYITEYREKLYEFRDELLSKS